MKKFLLLLLLVTLPAFAQNNAGLAYYAIQHKDWPCMQSLSTLREAEIPRLSFLYNTFGNRMECLNKFVSVSGRKEIEIALINEVCQRNNRCGPYEFLYGISKEAYRDRLIKRDKRLIKKLKEYVAPIAAWVKDLPLEVSCSINPGLESNLPIKAAKVLFETLTPLFPRCSFVWNPLSISSGGRIPGTIFELHGAEPRPKLTSECMSNLDGQDISLFARPSSFYNQISEIDIPNYINRHKDCRASFLWILEFNGNCQNGSFVDPRNRKCFPTPQIFNSFPKYLKNALPASLKITPDPADTASCKTMLVARDGDKKGFLWKQSDTQPGAVSLLPQKDRFNKVYVTKDGRIISNLTYAYQYTEDGSNRQVWRSLRPAIDFPLNVVLHADEVCYHLDVPKFRID